MHAREFTNHSEAGVLKLHRDSSKEASGGAISRVVQVPAARAILSDDTLAERLRRRPAKPMGSPRVGSNPTGVGIFLDAGGANSEMVEQCLNISSQNPGNLPRTAVPKSQSS